MHLRSTIRVLVVDDFEPFRQFICSTLQSMRELEVVSDVSDGLQAVQRAQELQPDLILLDLGLPKLNGIEAARRIRKLSPKSKIVFVSQNSSAVVAQEALDTGARGYVVKSDAGRELFTAVQAVLEGAAFVSFSLAGQVVASEQPLDQPQHDNVVAPSPLQEIHSRHEIAFYPDDSSIVEGFKQFVEGALRIGSAVIAITTELRRASLLQQLRVDGIDVSAAIRHGSYIPLDVIDMLSTFMIADMPDPVRFQKVATDLITRAARTTKGKRRRVAVCGDCAPTLLAEGKVEAAVHLEHLWDEIAKRYDVNVLCGYLSDEFQDTENFCIFERICAEHSAVHAD